MRKLFVYVALLLLVAAGATTYLFSSNPGSQTLVGAGPALPAYNNSVTFVQYPASGVSFTGTGTTNSTTEFTVSYSYGDSGAWLDVTPCLPTSAPCSTPPSGGQVILNISGASGSGHFAGTVGTYYIAYSNEAVVVSVNQALTTSALGEMAASIALGVFGLVLLVVGVVLRDPAGRPTPRVAQLKRTLYFFFQSKLAVLGLALLVFFILVAVLSPVLAPYSPTTGNGALSQVNGNYASLTSYCSYTPSVSQPAPCGFNQCVYSTPSTPTDPGISGNCLAWNASMAQIAPTWTAWPFNLGALPLGTIPTTSSDFISIYQGEIRATPWDLAISTGIVLSGAMIGLCLGAISGYLGGYFDEIIMRLTDIFLSIPGFFLILVMLSLYGGGSTSPPPPIFTGVTGHITLLIVAFVITWWPGYTRVVRGQVLVTREQKYVEASRAGGGKPLWVLRKHIIPNSIYPVLVQISLDVGSIPLSLGAIVFLGFGSYVFPTTGTAVFPEWGVLSASGLSVGAASANNIFTLVFSQSVLFPWWQVLFPGLALFLFCIAVNFLSDGLRDALDPRLRR